MDATEKEKGVEFYFLCERELRKDIMGCTLWLFWGLIVGEVIMRKIIIL